MYVLKFEPVTCIKKSFQDLTKAMRRDIQLNTVVHPGKVVNA